MSGKSMHPSHCSSDNDIVRDGDVLKTHAIQRRNSGDSTDSDHEEARKMQQEIQAKQQQWMQHQIQRQQNLPANGVANLVMNPNMNMMMQMQMQQQYLQMQQQYMQQQYLHNSMMPQAPPPAQHFANNMFANQQPVFVDELPVAPSEVQLPDHYTARLSLDPNGVQDVLGVHGNGEPDAGGEGNMASIVPDEDDEDTEDDNSIYDQMK
eukprot:CAMPEP_0197044580 /NCGR_PEP_ID=MMETSP1384-20130603/20602_1 /TAXON_ID=29189 /ORGANISM="Ammonia sp." /LENGTH=207 /DNA_ID=CAMNT_0042476061 /DNA_START=242 /DNA_END=865 /DNA_ORIENTATION=-